MEDTDQLPHCRHPIRLLAFPLSRLLHEHNDKFQGNLLTQFQDVIFKTFFKYYYANCVRNACTILFQIFYSFWNTKCIIPMGLEPIELLHYDDNNQYFIVCTRSLAPQVQLRQYVRTKQCPYLLNANTIIFEIIATAQSTDCFHEYIAFLIGFRIYNAQYRDIESFLRRFL